LNNVLVIGPLVIPYALLLVLSVLTSSLIVGAGGARKAHITIEPELWKTLIVSLVVARLAFVWEFRSAYMLSPLSMLDIRDGGWNATAGFGGAWLFALSLYGRRPALRKPLQAAMVTGSLVWIVGSIVLAIQPGTGQELPALEFRSLKGQTVPLTAFKGKPAVVNLWATWCPPCVREMPVLQQAQMDRPGVNFVFINQGEPPAKVDAWLRARNLRLDNVLLDEARTAGAAFKQSALPMTLFFDAEGRLVSTRIGELSQATLADRLAATGP
jgi:thiol-disulfide isomerase/thioredoxin